MALADDPIERLCQRQETIDSAKDIFRQAKVKTRDGSGYQLGSSTTGLPAICSLIASERLKNGDVTPEAAQVASCLNKRAFSKALSIVKAALGVTAKKKVVVSYLDLLDQYRAETYKTWLPPFFHHAQNALHQIDSRYKEDDPAVRCGIFFWACNSLKVKLPSTTAFAKDHELSLKLFISIVSTLNEKCSQLQTRILKAGANVTSPTKSTASASTPSQRTSPRKQLRELPSKETPKRAPAQSAVAVPSQKPLVEFVGYSSENEDIEMAVPETPSKKRKLEIVPRPILRSSPVKPLVFQASSSRLTLDGSPTKTPTAASTLNTPSRSVSTKKLRELPSKDSPRKRVEFVAREPEIEGVVSRAPAPPAAEKRDNEDVEMAAPETSRKRRKLEPSMPVPVATPTRPVTRSSPAKPSLPSTRSSSRIDALRGQVVPEAPRTPTRPKPKTSTRTSTSTVVEVSITPVRRGRPPKNPRPIPMEVDQALDAPSSEDEEEEEEPRPRRFRPVYLESKQWYSRDRRLARIWKAAEKYKRGMVELYGHPLDELRDDDADDGMDED